MSIRILLLGNGGREHALAWRISQSELLDRLYVCPGNGGTAQEPKTTNVDLSPTDFPRLVEFAVKNEVFSIGAPRMQNSEIHIQINLVVPGPEQPLVDGIETYFRKGTTSCSQRSR
jgi:phosphoribosylamine--glycine ligase/phosphoribosylformylglycinamidine cyclo-ligase